MTDYREILRLRYLGFNHSQIATSLGVSRQTVLNTMQRVATQDVDWQAAEGMNDRDLAAKLFPAVEGKPNYKTPDYAYIHQELAKPGMTQQRCGSSIATSAETAVKFLTSLSGCVPARVGDLVHAGNNHALCDE